MTQQKSTGTRTKSSASAAAAAAIGKRWLMSVSKKGKGTLGNEVWNGGFFDSVTIAGLQISHAEGGRILGSFRVPAHLTDAEGNWQAGAIAALIDVVGGVAIMTVVGHVKVSVDFDISYFSPAKIGEEVEIDAGIVEHKGTLTAVAVEIRKKKGDGRRMVAMARHWMASGLPLDRPSKL